MKVSVKQIFKSIHVIQDFEIPDFVVLTGGSGDSDPLIFVQKYGGILTVHG